MDAIQFEFVRLDVLLVLLLVLLLLNDLIATQTMPHVFNGEKLYCKSNFWQ